MSRKKSSEKYGSTDYIARQSRNQTRTGSIHRLHGAAVPQSKTARTFQPRIFLTSINRMYRMNPMHRVAGPLALAGTILFIDVKNLRDIRRK